MANVYQPTGVVLQRMLDRFKAITGITLSPSQLDDSTVVKLTTIAGGISFFTSQVQGAYNDFFPASASEPALEQHLYTRSLPPRIQAQSSTGLIRLTGTAPGQVFPAGAQITRTADGSTYTSIQSGTTGADSTVQVYFESDNEGSDQNLDTTGEPFTLSTPITNFSSSCTNTTPFLDGRDVETAAEMFGRVIAHDQDENSGGNIAAYQAWAYAASPAVVTAKSIRLPRGPDTVDTYITSGTTDIAAAVRGGNIVSRIPSAALIAAVQAYVTSLNPTTDNHLTRAPVEAPFDVTITYSLYSESTVNRAYVDRLIDQVTQIYLYSALSGDTINPTSLERLIDQECGDMLLQRAVANFSGVTAAYTIPNGTILKPGTITKGTMG